MATQVTNSIARVAAAQIKKALEDKEAELDKEIAAIDDLDEDDFERIRYIRKKELLQQQKFNAMWKMLGHGEVYETTGELDFFDCTKNSPKVVVHFYKRDSNVERSEYLTKHMQLLARSHLDIRFVSCDVEKHPFLVNRLSIRIIPTMLFIKEMRMHHTSVGFSELNDSDDWKERDLENLLQRYGMMEPFPPTWKDTRKEIVEGDEN